MNEWSQERIDRLTEYGSNFQREFVQEVGDNIINELGGTDAKYNASVSLAAHTVNACFIGSSMYFFDKLVREDLEPQDLDIYEVRLLLSALALHDVNKIVSYTEEEYIQNNSKDVLKKYFEDDILGIQEYLTDDDEVESLPDSQFDDLLYLILKTEVKEDDWETREIETEYQNLQKYCRAGDAISSALSVDGLQSGIENIEREFFDMESTPVQHLSFEQLQQPLIMNVLLQQAKEIVSQHGIILTTSPTDIVYLGNKLDKNELKEQLLDKFGEELGNIDPSFKAKWDSINYDSLVYMPIPFGQKRKMVAEKYKKTVLEQGQATDRDDFDGFDESAFPDNYIDIIPEALHKLYVEKDEDFDGRRLREMWDELTDIHGKRKAKVAFFENTVEQFEIYESELRDISDQYKDSMRKALETKGDIGNKLVSTFLGLSKNNDELEVPPADRQCFLCGMFTDINYEKGQKGFYGGRSFSRKTKPNQEKKKICPECNLEYSILSHMLQERGYSLNADIGLAYLYYDEFVPSLEMFSRQIEGLEDDFDLDDPEPAIDLMSQQYHIKPFYLGDQNDRLNITRDMLELVNKTGMKATIDTPFSSVNIRDEVFYDSNPNRYQETSDIATVERFGDVKRALDFLDIGLKIQLNNENGINKGFIQIRDDPHVIAHEAAKHLNINNPNIQKLIMDYLHTYHEETAMMMNDIAESGEQLYGKSYDSKHTKTVVFRETLDALLDGLNRGMDRDELVEFAAGRAYAYAERQEYTGVVKSEDAKEFVELIIKYLDEHGFLDVEKLSDSQNALIDTYLFAYEEVI